MIKMWGILGILSIMALFSVSAEGADWEALSNPVYSLQKRISIFDDYAIVQGRWRKTASTAEYQKLARLNTTELTCNKQNMVCNESTAVLYTPADDHMYNSTILSFLLMSRIYRRACQDFRGYSPNTYGTHPPE